MGRRVEWNSKCGCGEWSGTWSGEWIVWRVELRLKWSVEKAEWGMESGEETGWNVVERSVEHEVWTVKRKVESGANGG